MAEPEPLSLQGIDGPEGISSRPTQKKNMLTGPLEVRMKVQTLLTLGSPGSLPN